jgi:exodeoxyribonuclease VII small subunit
VPAKKDTAVQNELAEPPSYEAAFAELEQIVQQMESGELALEASLAAYERGAYLRQFCEQKLKAIEQRISVIDGDDKKPYSPMNSANA